jgi:hypothetical protein
MIGRNLADGGRGDGRYRSHGNREECAAGAEPENACNHGFAQFHRVFLPGGPYGANFPLAQTRASRWGIQLLKAPLSVAVALM